MAFFMLILLAVTLFLLTLSAILAGALGVAYVLRWVWPAIDPGSATITGLIALLVTIQLAWRFINQVSREEVETADDEDDDDGEVGDEEEARRIRRLLWRVQPDTEVYIPKQRRRRRRGRTDN